VTGDYSADIASIQAAAAAAEPPPVTGPVVEPFGDYRDLIARDEALSGNGDGERLPAEPEDSPFPEDLRFNDSDNSTRLILRHGDRIRYVLRWGKWITWERHAWTLGGGEVKVREMAKDVSSGLYAQAASVASADEAKAVASWATRSASKAAIEGMVQLARGIDGVPLDHNDLDADPWLLGVRNGVINLRDGTHRPGDPADLMHMQASTDYDADADCPTWNRCMADWFPDEDIRRYVQRLAGSALVGRQKDHRFIIHYGDGGNGKGTFIRGVMHVLGDYFVTPDKSLIVQDRYGGSRHTTERVALFRKRLAVAVESDRREHLNEAQVKNLTGSDRINGRRLYEDPWEFDPSHSLWLQTNYLPEIQGRDGGIWSRIRVVPWNATFRGTTIEDTELDDKLQDEAPGILNWLIAGCLQWQTDGLNEPAGVLNATAHYRASEDLLGRFAEETGLEFMPRARVTIKKLRGRLDDWCRDEGIHTTPNRNDVADWLKAQGALHVGRKQIDGEAGTWWTGVGFSSTLPAGDTPPPF
jgi:putative DNA primase/helicase